MSSGVDGLPIPGELPADGDGPVFDAPWQAQAFSLVVNLHKAGLFEWKTWAEIFSAEIAAAPLMGRGGARHDAAVAVPTNQSTRAQIPRTGNAPGMSSRGRASAPPRPAMASMPPAIRIT